MYSNLIETIFSSHSGDYLSVDTEDYTTTVYSGLGEDELRKLPSNLANNVDILLDAFGQHSYHCTFFILGRIADRIKPQLRRMVKEGHEVASHGMSHRRVLELSREQFRIELETSKAMLEDITGYSVNGFRAPMFSITEKNLWALDVLMETGYRYDSSVSPVSNFAYGIKDAPHHPHRLKNGLIEIPMSVVRILGYPFMLGGGFYLRAYPLWLHKFFMKIKECRTNVYYLHPWEIDDASYNLWSKIPDRGEHWENRPGLMKFIETYNRRNILDRYIHLIDSQASSPPVTLNVLLDKVNLAHAS